MASSFTTNPAKYVTVQPTYTVKQSYLGYIGGYQYFPGVGGSSSGGASAPPPAAAAPPPAPSVPTSIASDLQVLLTSIPIAQDGQVISAEYHNNMRATLIAMANHLGLGTISEEIFVTNAPCLTPSSGTANTAWVPEVGAVKKPAAAGNLSGWMEFDLPQGARIKKMQVYASTDSGNGTMRVKLRRQSVSGSAGDDLIVFEITNTDATIVQEGDVTIPQSTLAASGIEEARIVDNQKFKYLFVAELDNGVQDKNARINSVQVVLGK